MAESNPYILMRSQDESARLERQHMLWNETLGYDLHPQIRKLPAVGVSPSIAEIGTGTAVWLRDLAPTLAPTAQLVGIDISPDQFPEASTLPENVELILANATEPAADRFRGHFDIVHLRLLIGGMMTPDHWIRVGRTAFEMLKPGGAIQWFEGDFSSLSLHAKPNPALGADAVALQEYLLFWRDLFGGDTFYTPVRQIDTVLEQVKFERVRRELVSCEKDLSKRARWAEVIFGAIDGMVWKAFAGGRTTKEWTRERLEELSTRAKQDLEHGAYYEWDLNCYIGFKPDISTV